MYEAERAELRGSGRGEEPIYSPLYKHIFTGARLWGAVILIENIDDNKNPRLKETSF